MRRLEFVLAVSIAILGCATGVAAQSDSLGDYARAVRKEKRPAAKKSYTNDNLPTSASISVVGASQIMAEEESAPNAQDSKEKQGGGEKEKQDSDKHKAQKEDKTAERKPAENEQEWHDQVAEQKKQISDLEHELDLLKREYNLQVANYYADAGTQLRDQKMWGEQEAKYRSDIADKQKQIERAKTQLQDMEEDARRAGMTSSVSE